MNAFSALLAVLCIAAAALMSGYSDGLRGIVLLVLPYAAVATFVLGFSRKVLLWASSPVPFHIPVTCGQQSSLSWIRDAKVDNPTQGWGVFLRMAGEVLLFRSLFRNNRARMHGERLIVSENKYLWLGALAFHWALLLILLRHLRIFLEPVPGWVAGIEKLDGFLQVGAPPIYLSDVFLLAALVYLLIRRFREPMLRYISLFSDYFALFLLLGIGVSGAWMRYLTGADVATVKQYALGVVAFHPAVPGAISSVFLVHLLLVCVLAAYFPFSKLMHMGGVFLSPTRNLANNSRRVRHINPWNYPVKTHTYAEWEEEFHDKIKAAGIPMEAGDAGTAHSN
jgi:nitrate reductase gamma subunit